MKLSELLDTLPDDRIFYLTTGVGNFFGGNKAALSEAADAFDTQFARQSVDELANRKQAMEEHAKQVEEYEGGENINQETLKKMKLRLKALTNRYKKLADMPLVPLYDREVKECFQRITEDALCIVVKGWERPENGRSIWWINEEERERNHKKIEIRDNSAAVNLAGALMRGLAKEYACALLRPDTDKEKPGAVGSSYRALTSPWAQVLALGNDVEGIARMVRKNPDALLRGGED